MKTNTTVVAIALVALAAAGAGYWFGQRGTPSASASASATQAAASAPAKERKVLYYRNPMGLPDTSPVPKKDPMGMDYIAVYEGEEQNAPGSAGEVRISTEKIQKLGVRTEAAAMRNLGQAIRAAGRVEPDERHLHVIAPKFEGYVERLYVNVTGQPVGRGQPLFDVYSPELVAAQREYAIAVQGLQQMAGAGPEAQAGMKQLAESALARLRNWDLPPEQIAALVKSGEPRRTVTFRSPVGGIVTEKKAVQGMRFMPGEMLYQVTDLSSVWVVAEVHEQEIGQVRTGAPAMVRLNAYPDRMFQGRITYVYPTLKADTRTVPVRIELANPGGLLKPAMFAEVEVQVGARAPVLAVPDSAVIDSGTRRLVIVDRGEGRFEPREVKLGARGGQYAQVVEGVKEGESVVVAANFLIDAESNLKAAVSGLTPAQPAAPATVGPVGHKASGTVESVDANAGTVTLNHGAVTELRWPAMTMEFKVANGALLAQLQPKAKVNFEFVERGKGEWVITRVAQ